MYNVEKNQKGYTAVCLCRRRLADEDGEHFAINTHAENITIQEAKFLFFTFSNIFQKFCLGFVIVYTYSSIKRGKKLTFTFFSKQLIV